MRVCEFLLGLQCTLWGIADILPCGHDDGFSDDTTKRSKQASNAGTFLETARREQAAQTFNSGASARSYGNTGPNVFVGARCESFFLAFKENGLFFQCHV